MKKILLIVALLGAGISLEAQNVNEDKVEKKQMTQEERLDRQAKQMAERLMLDDKNTARFEKLYKEYQNEMAGLSRKSQKAAQTDEEIEAAMKENWNIMKKTAEIQEKYYGEFKKFLTVKQAQQVLNGGGRLPMGNRSQGMGIFGQGMRNRPTMGMGMGPQGFRGMAPNQDRMRQAPGQRDRSSNEQNGRSKNRTADRNSEL